VQLNHSRILSVGWTLVLAFSAFWIVALILAFVIGGETEATRFGTLFAFVLLLSLPIVIPFFLYSGIIFARRAATPDTRQRIKWVSLAWISLTLFGYLAWAFTKIQWK